MSNKIIELNGTTFKIEPFTFFRATGLGDIQNMLKPNQYLLGTLACVNVLTEGNMFLQAVVDYSDGASDFVGLNFRTSNKFENILFNKLVTPLPVGSVHFNGLRLTHIGDEFVSVFKDVEPVPPMMPPPPPNA
ncbi:hypothetical protein [Tenacibaculum ovolyticum]|uniref:hypothetical protein n=1 Tax=Tenacibaculum ovolyticum TaxID=104270 RepID=UPI001F474E20|nr:hypothetical protein [Tenacibaculum ovolyticum]